LWSWKKNQAEEIKQDVEKLLNKKVFMIPYSDHIYESQIKGIPISHYKPRSKVAKAYKKVADEYLDPTKEKKGNYY